MRGAVSTSVPEGGRSMEDLARLGASAARVLLALGEEGVVFHDAEGTIVDCNAAAERILGVRACDLVGRTSVLPFDRVVDEAGAVVPPEAEPFHDALRARRITAARRFRCTRARGVERWIELRSAPVVRAAGGDIRGVVTRVVDVGAARAREAGLRTRQRMEIMGHLAGSIAHDFNNLLTVILGYNGILIEQLAPGEHGWREADEVRSAAQRGAELTRQLLAIGSGQMIEFRTLDLRQYLADVVPTLRHAAGGAIELIVTAPAEPVPVRCDPGQLEQVLLNLVLNARDAMPEGGSVRMTLGIADLDGPFAAARRGLRAGRHVVIEVADEGCGMDEATRARIFEPFFTTKPRDLGTGLGLATAYGIVRQHDGCIEVESSPGRGTSVRILLRLCGDVPAMEPDRHPWVTRAVAADSVLLVVADEQLRRLARGVLERGGYRVLDERDGEQGLEAADRHQGPLAALVTDLVLPGLPGIELARRLTETRPETGVLFLSGYTEIGAVTPVLPRRGVHVLAKPFRPEALLDKLLDVKAGRVTAAGGPP